MKDAPVANVAWVDGGVAEIVSMVVDKIALRSTRPSPPGSRIEGTLDAARPVKLLVKIHLCQRQSNGEFILEGRALNLTRADREALALVPSSRGSAALAASGGEKGVDDH